MAINPERASSRNSNNQGLLVVASGAGLAVAALAVLLNFTLPSDLWFHDFLFRRSFVQWVLLTAFTTGIFDLLFRRMPAWLRERRALRSIQGGGGADADTVVGRRWLELRSAMMGDGAKNPAQLAAQLAEHDEAALEGAYRVSGDIVQILPLIGFFGTVFGLSKGLYGSFLANGADGGATTTAFAKAIAIAFDNTLLGLALTIVLFATQSILRKRDDAILLQTNLLANGLVARHDSPEVSELKRLAMELSRDVKQAVESHTIQVAAAVAERVAGLYQQNVAGLTAEMSHQATALFGMASEKLSELVTTGNPIWLQIASGNTKLDEIAKATGELTKTIVALHLEESQASKLSDERLIAAVEFNNAQLTQQGASLEQAIQKLDTLAYDARSLATRVDGIDGALHALPIALGQRDSGMIAKIEERLEAHTTDLKSETRRLINRPRRLTVLESLGDPEHEEV